MSNVKNLYNEDAVKKIKDFVDDIKFCMFCTSVTDMPFRTRPMSTLEVDEEGNLWFFSAKSSDKNDEIKDNDTVQLIYSKNSDVHFLTITGKATIVQDQAKKDELWNPIVKAYFPQGKDDPNLSLVKIKPEAAHYWDTINGKMITWFKMAASAVTGNQNNVGVEGKLKV
ncbi:general stress protein [Hanamia caeni]|jgi:general stress protein 26|uniref:General stress protein n=1 Tax=Hanamia caeni TaxID=2294116 RepID=A0A3M9NFQ7_9BACT|nr:pyridoxamine 5'-phosphate oxidase family protein [Hanamia caeni]RNI36619.1 general stress protein [Hanamia caeni]